MDADDVDLGRGDVGGDKGDVLALVLIGGGVHLVLLIGFGDDDKA